MIRWFTRKPLSERISRMLRENALRWPWPDERKPLVIEHVRYVKKPAICPRAKAHAMAVAMGMTKQAEVLK